MFSWVVMWAKLKSSKRLQQGHRRSRLHLSFQINHQRRRWRNRMKKFLLATVGLVALGMGAPASAADLAARPYTKAPPPIMEPMYNWSGFYVGLNAGGGSSHKCWDLIPGDEGCHDATGGTVGGQFGYRWQMSNWVIGLEAQGNWADFKGSNINSSLPDSRGPHRRSMRLACSPLRSAMPGTTPCFTSRAAPRWSTTSTTPALL